MPPKKKSNNGYKFAPPLPKGTVLEDIAKKKWKLGVSIGKGGFGEIYSAQEDGAKGDKYPYVVKIEPHGNGPLFVEINFYIRHAKKSDVEAFKSEHKLKTFGMPIYHGSGSHEYDGEKFRFLVMDKFGNDLYKLYTDNNKQFPVDTVFKLGMQIIDVLQYMHERGYVHADIKAANLLMGLGKDTQNKQVFLVDFGLASKYSLEKEFKRNPKKAHDGTIEYLSRDAHHGVQTRRGDLEILAYNLLHWFGCKLPWEDHLKDPRKVQSSKEESMASVTTITKACFGSKPAPKAYVNFLTYLTGLNFDTEPDYNKIKGIFLAGVKEAGGSVNAPLQFSQTKTPSRKTKTPLTNSRSNKGKAKDETAAVDDNDTDMTPKAKKRTMVKKDLVEKSDSEASDSDEEVIPKGKSKENRDTKVTVRRKAAAKKDLVDDDHSDHDEPPIKKRSNPKKPAGKASAKEKLDSDHEDEIEVHSDTEQVTKRRKINRKINTAKTNLKKGQAMSLNNLNNVDEFPGYTDAMKEVMRKKQQKGVLKKNSKLTKKDAIQEEDHEDMNGYNDEMKEVAIKKKAKGKSTVASTSRQPTRRNAKVPTSYDETAEDVSE